MKTTDRLSRNNYEEHGPAEIKIIMENMDRLSFLKIWRTRAVFFVVVVPNIFVFPINN